MKIAEYMPIYPVKKPSNNRHQINELPNTGCFHCQINVISSLVLPKIGTQKVPPFQS